MVIKHQFKIYLLIIAIIAVLLQFIPYIEYADTFDKYYSTVFIVCVCSYGLIIGKDKTSKALIHFLTIGILFALLTIIVFYFKEMGDKWFTFERDSYTWLGLLGVIKTVIYTTIGTLIGMILWFVKTKVLELIKK